MVVFGVTDATNAMGANGAEHDKDAPAVKTALLRVGKVISIFSFHYLERCLNGLVYVV